MVLCDRQQIKVLENGTEYFLQPLSSEKTKFKHDENRSLRLLSKIPMSTKRRNSSILRRPTIWGGRHNSRTYLQKSRHLFVLLAGTRVISIFYLDLNANQQKGVSPVYVTPPKILHHSDTNFVTMCVTCDVQNPTPLRHKFCDRECYAVQNPYH